MLEQIRARIADEMDALTRELKVELPQRIKKAAELGDLSENSEYKSALERQQFVQARIGHLSRRMSDLGRINVADVPADRVGFGSEVRVHDSAMKAERTFTIVAGDFIDLEKGHISLESPIGRGLLGAREGDDVTVELPVGPRRYRILELKTLPQQLDEGKPRQSNA